MPTVLIADDSPTLRRIVGDGARARGLHRRRRPRTASRPCRRVFRTQPDAVILDVQMPRRVRLRRRARCSRTTGRPRTSRSLLLTSLDAATDRYWGAQVGADRFLTKDFEAPAAGRGACTRSHRGRRRARGGRPPLRPDPVELGDDDVFGAGLRAARPQAVRGLGRRRGHRHRRGRARLRGDRRRGARRARPRSSTTTWPPCCMLDDRATYLTVARDTSHAAVHRVLRRDRRRGHPGDRRAGRWCTTWCRGSPTPNGSPRRGRRGPDGDLPVDAAAGRRPDRRRARRCPARPRTPSARPR